MRRLIRSARPFNARPLTASRFTARLSRLALAISLSCGAVAGHAAQHQLTRVDYDAAKNVNVIDLVMSIDWDFDSAPAGRDKDFIEGIIKQSSQSLFTLTEGRQMLGKVYVYKNSQFMDNTDIQYKLADGRANANLAGIGNCKACRILMFAGTNEPVADHGKTVAHEFGHYILGLYDEYREEGGKSTEAGSPQDGDTPRDTIMHNHLAFTNLSTADDYKDAATSKTAQFRVYGKSAWETLVSDPANDPNGGIGRTWFEPFKKLSAPTAASLSKPASGWEGAVQVVYMGSNNPTPGNALAAGGSGPISVIVIDTTVGKAQFDAQLNAAQQMVNSAGDNNRIAVFAHPYANAPVVPLTQLSQAATRNSIKNSIARIGQAVSSDDQINADRLFDWAEAALPALFPAGSKSAPVAGYYARIYNGTGQAVAVKDGQVIYYNGQALQTLGPLASFLPQARLDLSASLKKALASIQAVRSDADTPAVTLLTSESATVDADVASRFRDAKVQINPVVLVGPSAAGNRFTAGSSGQTSLYDLAQLTAGQFKEANKPADLAREAVKAANALEGDNYESVNDASADALKAGASSSTTTLIAGNGADGSAIDGEVIFQAFWSDVDDGKISYTLTAPNGDQITPATLPAGITYSSPPGEGLASYTVSPAYAKRAGSWQSTVSANADSEDAVFQEIAVKSNLFAGLDVFGGSPSDKRPLFAVVEVAGPLPVKGATVVADVLSASTGQIVKSAVPFKDDGQGSDSKANDGRYSASLADLPVGDYEIVARISGDGSAAFTTSGSLKKGTNKPDIAIPPFQRTAMDSFKKEL